MFKLKLLLAFSFLFLLPFTHFSQNWAPINSSEQFNYSLDNSPVITHALKIDSVHVSGQDSTMYLNRMLKKCTDCDYLDQSTFIGYTGIYDDLYQRNQSLFLNDSIEISGSEWTFRGGSTEFILKPEAGLLEGWEFYPDSSQMAYVVNISEQEIFGTTDSVKLISFGTGELIKLSKNHGIIEFPQFNQLSEFKLKGINERQLGLTTLAFQEAYSFENGDSFLFKVNEGYCISYDNHALDESESCRGIMKKTVIGIANYQDSIKVDYFIVRGDTCYSHPIGEPWIQNVDFYYETYNQTEWYFKEDFNETASVPSTENDDFRIAEYYQSDNGEIILTNGGFYFLNEFFYDFDFYHFPDAIEWNSWDYDEAALIDEGLNPEDFIFKYRHELDEEFFNGWFQPDADSRAGIAYSSGLGKVSDFERESYFGGKHGPSGKDSRKIHLLAYEKNNGSNGGIMVSDDVILGIEDLTSASDQIIHLFPNPVSDKLTISAPSQISQLVFTTVSGEEMMTKSTNNFSAEIDINEFPKGIYLVKIKLANGHIITRRFLKQ